MTLSMITLSWLLSAGAPGSTEEALPEIDLNRHNYDAWRDHILPAKDELAWEKIPWLTTFHDGISAAKKAKKPLLLWVMNGHPLGCT
jgi:hypothetical protein